MKKHRRLGESMKKRVAAAQEWRCATCQKMLPATFQVDHVFPHSLGAAITPPTLKLYVWNVTPQKVKWNKLALHITKNFKLLLSHVRVPRRAGRVTELFPLTFSTFVTTGEKRACMTQVSLMTLGKTAYKTFKNFKKQLSFVCILYKNKQIKPPRQHVNQELSTSFQGCA